MAGHRTCEGGKGTFLKGQGERWGALLTAFQQENELRGFWKALPDPDCMLFLEAVICTGGSRDPKCIIHTNWML